MNRKKPDITQEICDQVKFLIKGGATNRKAGAFVGLSASTVSRIRTANYNAEQYRKNNEIRNAEEKLSLVPDYFTKDAIENVSPEYIEDKEQPGTFHLKMEQNEAGNQVPGQMAMELPESDMPQEVTVKLQELMEEVILTAQVREITEKIEESQLKTRKVIYAGVDRITAKLDKLNDNLCQILRRMDK